MVSVSDCDCICSISVAKCEVIILKKIISILISIICALFALTSNQSKQIFETINSLIRKGDYENYIASDSTGEFAYGELPEYTNEAYITINNNEPFFTKSEWEGTYKFSELDTLGRCGEAVAIVGPETLAEEERGSIKDIKPSGWHTVRYDELIGSESEPGYLFNRCHLIMYALLGQESNVKENLITGTRYMNVEGMLPNEIQIVNYIEETGNHVEYHVTPIFVENELVARGVLIQAKSIEDETFKLNVFAYNVQPQIVIDYATGESYAK